MFGTDWSATWQFMQQPGSVHQIARDTVLAATRDPGVHEQIFGETARQVYATAIAAARAPQA